MKVHLTSIALILLTSVVAAKNEAAAACIENPSPISHGRPIASTKTHGSLVKYVCEEYYMQVGKSQVQCLQGVWIGELPKCIDSRCYLKDLQHAENIAPVTPDITLSGDHLNVTCDEGYTTRPVIPLCLNGKWNRNTISPCKERTCNKPPPKVINAVEEIIFRTVVKYRCKKPYVLEGPSHIECVFGEWKGPIPKCTDKNCAEPPSNVIHATVEVISTPQNKLAKYVCKEPYLLVGNSEIPCLFGGWNGTAPTCKDSRCYLDDLQTAENLAKETPMATNSGKKVDAICKAGYTLDEERPVCQNGAWIKNSSSICKESTCSIPNVGHGDIVEEHKGGFYFNMRKLQYERSNLLTKMPLGRIVSPGNSYTLLCYQGYVVQGKSDDKSEISCVAGKWLPEPVCVVGDFEERLTTTKDETITKPTMPSTTTENSEECFCTYNFQTGLLAATVGGRKIESNSRVRRGDVVSFGCLNPNMNLRWQNGLRLLGPVSFTCECGNLKEQDLPTCESRKSGINVFAYNNKMKFLPGGIIGISRGENIEIQCINSYAPPQWNTLGRDGLTISSEFSLPSLETTGFFVASMFIRDADDKHSGRYECSGPFGFTTPLELRIYGTSPSSLSP